MTHDQMALGDHAPASDEGAGSPDALSAALTHLAQVTAQGVTLAQQAAAGTDLVPAGGSSAAVAARAQLAEARAALARQQEQIKAAQDLVKAELDKQLAAAQEALAPIKELVARMEEGIWTVNLYLGRDEEIVTLRGQDHEPAAADEPLTVRQLVLFMDEETAIGAEHGGLDARSIDAFDEWLLADPAHLDQVIPEAKGVVALMPRRNRRDYGDPWVNTTMDKANKTTYFLIRNGRRLYRMTTEFDVGVRLVPGRTEFLMPVADRWGHPLEPGSREWLAAEKAVSARERHFMRVALILQGLIDRTTVFQPVRAGLSLLDPAAYDTGAVRLLDDEHLTLTTGRQPFRQWQRERCALLRPGMRVAIATGALGKREHADWHISPQSASGPSSAQIHRIERRDGQKLVVLYERTDVVYDRDTWEPRTPTKRASFTFDPTDQFIIPVDAVTLAECEAYLNARTERHAYEDMFPALKTAIAAKKAELEFEVPVRDLIAAQIVLHHGVDHDTATTATADLVDWWKTGNRWHRALAADETKAITAIVAEFGRRAAAVTSGDEPAIVATLRTRHTTALLIARKKDGTWVVIEPQPRRWPEAVSGHERVYTRHITYSKTATGPGKVTEWKVTEPAVLGRWRILHEGPGWATWDKGATTAQHLTDAEIDDLATQLRTLPGNEHVGAPLAVVYGEHYNTITYSLDPFTVYFLPAGGPNAGQAGHLLTGPAPALEVPRLGSRWSRKAGKATLSKRARADRVTGQTFFAGDMRHRAASSMADVPWGELSGRDVPHPVWVDENALATYRGMVAAHREHVRSREALVERAQRALQSIADAWQARAEELAYARFLEDFADPALWEGHRKSLHLTYPYSVRWFDGAQKDGLHRLVWLLVEQGVDLDGLSVAEALARHGGPVTKVGFMGKAEELPVPQDVMDLRFTCPAPAQLPASAHDERSEDPANAAT